MNRESYTSTKLANHVYVDKQCSMPYEENGGLEAKNGYIIDGQVFYNRVSFRPPFYSCLGCQPEEISGTFKKSRYWYDDDYINVQGGQKQYTTDDADDSAAGDDANVAADDANGNNADANSNDDGNNNDDANAANDNSGNTDDLAANYFTAYDDDANAYAKSNNDNDGSNDDGKNNNNNNNNNNNMADDFYKFNDDAARNRKLIRYENPIRRLGAAPGVVEVRRHDFCSLHLYFVYHAFLPPMTTNVRYVISMRSQAYQHQFWDEIEDIRRSLEDSNQNNDANSGVGNWNLCQRFQKYGMDCDESCQQLDTFHVNEWSNSDIFLLVIMCVFMAAMMLLVFAKRVKAYEKASIYGDEFETTYPGLPPLAMVLLFGVLMAVIVTLAHLKLVNETLVFAVITCILLFIYMLKLTLFENRPQLMSSSTGRGNQHSIAFDSMNRQLFDA